MNAMKIGYGVLRTTQYGEKYFLHIDSKEKCHAIFNSSAEAQIMCDKWNKKKQLALETHEVVEIWATEGVI